MSRRAHASPLVVRAGSAALAHLRAHGLRPDDVAVMPAASGGAKWLAIGGLDRVVFGEFLAARTRPLHGIGSSIGSWRLACLGQRDPVAALARGHEAYIEHQRYSPKPDAAEVTRVLGAALDHLLGPRGADEVLAHPWLRVHVITAEARGLAAAATRPLLGAGLALAAAGNFVSRRTLALQLRRAIYHSAGDATPFAHLRDLPTVHRRLTRENLRAALLASGSIPLLMEGVRIPGPSAATHWDGGMVDYHVDVDFGVRDGLVLYPHFHLHVVPGWFDKSLPWRRARGANFARAVLVAPSPAWVATLPGAKIPDRRDFYTMPEAERIRRWRATLEASAELGDAFRDLVRSGRIADVAVGWEDAA